MSERKSFLNILVSLHHKQSLSKERFILRHDHFRFLSVVYGFLGSDKLIVPFHKDTCQDKILDGRKKK
jgi:hypothetical protein